MTDIERKEYFIPEHAIGFIRNYLDEHSELKGYCFYFDTSDNTFVIAIESNKKRAQSIAQSYTRVITDYPNEAFGDFDIYYSGWEVSIEDIKEHSDTKLVIYSDTI